MHWFLSPVWWCCPSGSNLSSSMVAQTRRDALPVQLPLNATKPLPTSADEAQSHLEEADRAGRLAPLRRYFATAREVQYDLSDEARQRLVDEFVQMRKRDPTFGERIG